MANALYELTKAKMLQAGIDMDSDDVIVILLDNTYTFSQSHDFISDLTGEVDRSGNLTSKTFTNGVFDAADVTLTAVTGNQVTSFVIAIDSGTDSTSPLIAYFDTSVTGLPVTPNGGDIQIAWNASGIFKL